MVRSGFWSSALLAAALASAQDSTYQVDLGPIPTDGQQALDTVALRAATVIQTQACGDELKFYQKLSQKANDEDITGAILAKLEWYRRTVSAPGVQIDDAGHVSHASSCTASRIYDTFDTSINLPAAMNAALAPAYPKGCDGFTATAEQLPKDHPVFTRVTYTVPPDCIRAQINSAIPNLSQNHDGAFHMAGTDGSVCWEKPVDAGKVKFTIPGDWDVAVRDLTRIYLIDSRWRSFLRDKRAAILSDDARTYLRDQLLTIRGGPGPDTYALDTCANSSDYSTGSPDTAADEDNWVQNALSPTGQAGPDGDVWKWLLSRVLDLVIIAAAAGALAAAGPIILGVMPDGGLTLAAIASAAAVAGVVAVPLASIPETENHRLMIESSRYLYDRLAAIEATDPSHQAQWSKHADEVKRYLLQRLQGILKNDFIEYNARPYQRYSNVALLNLYDFAGDDDLRTAAQMALEYSTIKFAVGSNQGRRSVPFRRRMEVLTGITSMLELGAGDDYQVSQMLLFAGQTQQTPQTPRNNGYVSFTSVGDMIYAATSEFRPHPAVLDLAIRKDTAYLQRLHYAGAVEIYSGAASYVISAGGVLAPAAYSLTEGAVALPAGGDRNPFIQDVDRGAAMPTALMLSTGTGDKDRLNLIRIEGASHDFGNAGNSDHPTWRNFTYNHNTCVWKGFACGMNVMMAPPAGCTLDSDGAWTFINSANCQPGTPKFYVAVRMEPCSPTDEDACQANPGNQAMRPTHGFFEVADAPAGDYDSFRTFVKTNNPQPFGDRGTGTYHSYSGHTIEFDCAAHQHDSNKWGVTRIDGTAQDDISKWPFASGDVLNSAGDGVLTFTNPRLGKTIRFDYTDANHPKRTLQ